MYDSAYLVKEMTTSRSIQKDGVAMAADVGSLAEKAHVLVENAQQNGHHDREQFLLHDTFAAVGR